VLFLTKRQCCPSVKNDERVSVGKASVKRFQKQVLSSNVMILKSLGLDNRTTLVLSNTRELNRDLLTN